MDRISILVDRFGEGCLIDLLPGDRFVVRYPDGCLMATGTFDEDDFPVED